MFYNSKISKELKAFVRIDGMGRIVAGSLILRKNKPKTGRWQQIPAFLCCGPTTFAPPSGDEPGGDDPGPITTTTSTTAESGDLVFLAELIGENEVPPVSSNAFGDATIVINTATNVASLVVGYTGIVPTGAHVHLGAVGVDGPIVITLDHTMNPITYITPPLSAAQEADLIAGMYYINLHTAAYPDGEIRGQFTLI